MNPDWMDSVEQRESPPSMDPTRVGNERIPAAKNKRKLSFPGEKMPAASNSSSSTSSGGKKKKATKSPTTSSSSDDKKMKAKAPKKGKKRGDDTSSDSSVDVGHDSTMPPPPPAHRAAAVPAAASLREAITTTPPSASLSHPANSFEVPPAFASDMYAQSRLQPEDETALLQSLLQQRRHRDIQRQQEHEWLIQQQEQEWLHQQQQHQVQLQRDLFAQEQQLLAARVAGISSPRLMSILNATRNPFGTTSTAGAISMSNPDNFLLPHSRGLLMQQQQQQQLQQQQASMYSNLLSSSPIGSSSLAGLFASDRSGSSHSTTSTVALQRRLVALQQQQQHLQLSQGTASDETLARLRLLSTTPSHAYGRSGITGVSASTSMAPNTSQEGAIDGSASTWSSRPSNLVGQLVQGVSIQLSAPAAAAADPTSSYASANPNTTPPNASRSPPTSRSTNRRSSVALSHRGMSPPTEPGMIAAPLSGPVTLKIEPLVMPPQQELGVTPPYDQRPLIVPLGRDEDVNWLSEFQCFVRSELLEVVRASQTDVQQRVASKKVHYLQAGIRCRFCAHVSPNQRAIRSSAYPSSLRQLYQSVTMMVRDHFGNCTRLPQHTRARYHALKQRNTQGASDSLRYWIFAAQRLGLVDCPSRKGILVTEQTQADAASLGNPPFGTFPTNTALDAESLKRMPPPPPPLPPTQARLVITPDDQAVVPPFVYELLHHVQVVPMLASERLGNRKNLEPGYPGLSCRYCCQVGRLGLSRIFPGKRKHLQPQIPQGIYDHLRRCTLIPPPIRVQLEQLHSEYDTRLSRQEEESSQNDDPTEAAHQAGSREVPVKVSDAFLDKVWSRLGHGKSAR